MRLVTFEVRGVGRTGIVIGEQVIDIGRAVAALGSDVSILVRDLSTSMIDLLRDSETSMESLAVLLDTLASGQAVADYAYPVQSVRLCAPIPVPGKILCIGQNYRDHVLEQNGTMPERPIIFAKFANTVIGPGDDIIHPVTTRRLDYEAELVVVIGREGKHIKSDEAYEYVAGYMIGQDITARDIQKGDGQWVRGKSQDTFAPLGPYLVTRDEVPDPQSLSIKLWVNGELRQDSNTSNLIFDVPALIQFISEGITLSPGDLIYTGTPPGVGAYRNPPVFLQPGDEISVEIEGLGRLSNRVVADPVAV